MKLNTQKLDFYDTQFLRPFETVNRLQQKLIRENTKICNVKISEITVFGCTRYLGAQIISMPRELHFISVVIYLFVYTTTNFVSVISGPVIGKKFCFKTFCVNYW